MEIAAAEGNDGTRIENHDEENADAHPGINAEIKTVVRKRQRRPRESAEHEAKQGWGFRTRTRAKKIGPSALRHQCFTIALNPAFSRPFFAASADLASE